MAGNALELLQMSCFCENFVVWNFGTFVKKIKLREVTFFIGGGGGGCIVFSKVLTQQKKSMTLHKRSPKNV